MAAGAPRRCRGLRGLSGGGRDRQRARPPVLLGRGTTGQAPPPPARRAVPDLGDAQRLARAGSAAGRGLRRDAGRHRDRRQRRSRRDRHRAHVHQRAGCSDGVGVPRARPGRGVSNRAASRAAPRSGHTPRWPWPCARSASTASVPTSTHWLCWRSPSGCCARAIAARASTCRRLAPADARRPAARLAGVGRPRRAVGRRPGRPAVSQDDRFTHADLYRRATRAHERRLRDAVARACRSGARRNRRDRRRPVHRRHSRHPLCPGGGLHRPRAFQAERPRRRAAADRDRRGRDWRDARRDAHDRGDPRGAVSRASTIEVIGTDRTSTAGFAAVADVEIPHYPGMEIGVPSLPAVVEAIADGRYDLIHVCSPGPERRGGGVDRPRDGDPAGRQLPHRARRLRRPSQRRSGARTDGAACRRIVLLAVPRRAVPEWRGRSRPSPSSGSPASGSRAGIAGSTPGASTLPCAASARFRATE